MREAAQGGREDPQEGLRLSSRTRRAPACASLHQSKQQSQISLICAHLHR